RILAAMPYGVASHDPESPRFDGQRYWRGPVWGIMNMLIALGLYEQGHKDDARHIRTMTRELITRHGFAEYFDPRDGTPKGGQFFTWTAAIWLGWASPNAGEF
ncbi:MAG: hypothetical protein AAF352_05955, partial [Pseudomonadota bacterium]